MQDESIKLSAEFPGLWLTHSVTLAPGDDPIAAFLHAKATVDAAYKAMTGGMTDKTDLGVYENPVAITKISKAPEDSRAARVQMFVNEINQCTEIDKVNSFGVQVGLLAFEELSKSDPAIMDAYLLKLKSLQ